MEEKKVKGGIWRNRLYEGVGYPSLIIRVLLVCTFVGVAFPIGFYTFYSSHSEYNVKIVNLPDYVHSRPTPAADPPAIPDKCSPRKLKPITTLQVSRTFLNVTSNLLAFINIPDTAEKRRLNEPSTGGVERIGQDDPSLLKYFWDNCEVLMRPPDGQPTTYKEVGSTSFGQDKIVRKILHNMTGGFFIEVGAHDGVTQSNTVEFERNFAWKGILIEAGPGQLVELHKFHRNAWISHACVSPRDYPIEVMFHPSTSTYGKISSVIDETKNISINKPNVVRDLTQKDVLVRIQCFPLYSFIAALNVKVIDFLSLDVEGSELQILKTIPFDKVLIRVIAVEIVTSAEGPGPYREFMESKGFKVVGVFYHRNTPFDLIFVHHTVQFDISIYQFDSRLKPQ